MLLGQLLLAKMSICPSIKNSKKLHDADRQQEEGLDKRWFRHVDTRDPIGSKN